MNFTSQTNDDRRQKGLTAINQTHEPNPDQDMSRQIVEFLGVKVDNINTSQLLETVLRFASGKSQRKVMYVNADCMLIAQKNDQYRQVLNRADLVYPDGTGVVLGARLLGFRMAGRSTAADFMPDFCGHLARRGLSVFLLGAREGVAKEAARRLLKRLPHLKIAGTHHGYFSKDETYEVITAVNNSHADVLLVGFGAPYQELWIHRYCAKLTPKVIWGVGGLFDFLSGRTPRGPKWLLDNGFEWLCRLAVEPRRLWRRYLFGNMIFISLVIRHRLRGVKR